MHLWCSRISLAQYRIGCDLGNLSLRILSSGCPSVYLMY